MLIVNVLLLLFASDAAILVQAVPMHSRKGKELKHYESESNSVHGTVDSLTDPYRDHLAGENIYEPRKHRVSVKDGAIQNTVQGSPSRKGSMKRLERNADTSEARATGTRKSGGRPRNMKLTNESTLRNRAFRDQQKELEGQARLFLSTLHDQTAMPWDRLQIKTPKYASRPWSVELAYQILEEAAERRAYNCKVTNAKQIAKRLSLKQGLQEKDAQAGESSARSHETMTSAEMEPQHEQHEHLQPEYGSPGLGIDLNTAASPPKTPGVDINAFQSLWRH
ncbi:hypothetical protein CBS101457_003432 [Exobasidium rhododendri]|nr:hypothetical protein CBS101457_003432 [Exobasidium rhododendri]